MDQAAVIIEGNLFERCDGELEIISVKNGGNAIRFNTIRESSGQISIRGGWGNVVEGNFILGEHKAESAGVRIAGSHHVVTSNHIQDLDPGGDHRRTALAMMVGSDQQDEGYLPVLDAVVSYNRILSPARALALDGTSTSGVQHLYGPTHNTVAHNLLFTGQAPVITGIPYLPHNDIEGNWTDVVVAQQGFMFMPEPITGLGDLNQVPSFEASLSTTTPPALAPWLIGSVLLDPTELYAQVPVLSAGDVGATRP